MKNLKRSRFFSLGRKWVFTLALFLFVFAAASVVKTQAAQNITGWLWGGSEDSSIGGSAGSIDGNETGLGWISMTGSNYGVTIPDTDGDLSGYAWSSNVGWISFDSADLSGCPSGTCSARREGATLVGWARIISIAQAGANAGGWQGWIKLASEPGDPVSYGVKINPDGTFAKCSASGDGCAWNGEDSASGVSHGFGWIDFSRAQIKDIATIYFDPSSVTMNEYSSSSSILKESKAFNCGNVTITNGSIVSASPSSAKFSAATQDSQNVSLDAGSVSGDTVDHITATSEFCGIATLDINILDAPTCDISAPSSFKIAPGQTDSYLVRVGVGCNLDSCDGSTGDGKITVSKNPDGTDSCQVKASMDAKYATTTGHAHSGSTAVPTEINVTALGWVEVN